MVDVHPSKVTDIIARNLIYATDKASDRKKKKADAPGPSKDADGEQNEGATDVEG